MTSTLDRAMVSPDQIAQLSHPLAAANHRHWILWERWVLPHFDQLTPATVPEFIRVARETGLDGMLRQNAQSVVDLVGLVVGSFAYPPLLDRVVERKLQQFTGWLAYAAGKTADDRTRWLLQCRTPFLDLPPQMQLSDYREAASDLEVIADAGGLVLSQPVTMKPLSPREARATRRLHALGIHGRYRDSEEPWSNVCLGCHRSWAVERP
jgi:hypothetical protein